MAEKLTFIDCLKRAASARREAEGAYDAAEKGMFLKIADQWERIAEQHKLDITHDAGERPK